MVQVSPRLAGKPRDGLALMLIRVKVLFPTAQKVWEVQNPEGLELGLVEFPFSSLS